MFWFHEGSNVFGNNNHIIAALDLATYWFSTAHSVPVEAFCWLSIVSSKPDMAVCWFSIALSTYVSAIGLSAPSFTFVMWFQLSGSDLCDRISAQIFSSGFSQQRYWYLWYLNCLLFLWSVSTSCPLRVRGHCVPCWLTSVFLCSLMLNIGACQSRRWWPSLVTAHSFLLWNFSELVERKPDLLLDAVMFNWYENESADNNGIIMIRKYSENIFVGSRHLQVGFNIIFHAISTYNSWRFSYLVMLRTPFYGMPGCSDLVYNDIFFLIFSYKVIVVIFPTEHFIFWTFCIEGNLLLGVMSADLLKKGA